MSDDKHLWNMNLVFLYISSLSFTGKQGQCLVECQANIFERFLKGIMIEKAKPTKVKVKKEEDGVKKEEGEWPQLCWIH